MRTLLGSLAAFLFALSTWTLAWEVLTRPKTALLAVRGRDLSALARAEGASLAGLLERARAAGATAVLVPDDTWAEAAASGRVRYFSKGQVAALRAVGLLDPEAPFPADALWLAPGDPVEPAARLLAASGVRVSTGVFSGGAVLRAAEGLDLERLRAGPDPRLLAAARAAGLLPVYELRHWDRNAGGILAAAPSRADFPRLALAVLEPEPWRRFAAAPEAKMLDEGVYRLEPGSAVLLTPERPGGALAPRLRDARPRLIVQALDPEAGVEAALAALRDTVAAAAAAGLEAATGPEPLQPRRAPPPAWPGLRRAAAWLAALALPWLCVGAALRILDAGLKSMLWPPAAPAWQIAAAYVGSVLAALAAGVLLDGLLGTAPPALRWSLLYLPFVAGAGFWYGRTVWALKGRLDRPLTLRTALTGAAVVLAARLLWSGLRPAALAGPEPAWRGVLVGATALLGAFWLRSRREAGIRGAFEDERPLLVLALWLPLSLAAPFYLSPAPFWVVAARGLGAAGIGLLAGSVGLAAAAFVELKLRARPIRSRWI